MMNISACNILSNPVAKPAVLAAVMLLAVLGTNSSVLAQQNTESKLTVVKEWEAPGSPSDNFSSGAISPDGLLEAHLGPRGFEDGLFIKKISSGEDKLILKEVEGNKAFYDISFSPDGSRLLFRTCPPMGADCGAPAIYTVGTDGTGITKVAKTTYDDQTKTEYRVMSPVYSPDGSKVLLDIEAVHLMKGTDENGSPLPPSWSHYVGVVSLDSVTKIPERLTQGKPYFWSADGNSIYYTGSGGFLRFNIPAKTSIAITAPQTSFRVLGRLSASNIAFVESTTDSTVTALSLDGSQVSENVRSFVSGISSKDSKGRQLFSIESGGPQELTLKYIAKSNRGIGEPKEHVELVSFQ